MSLAWGLSLTGPPLCGLVGCPARSACHLLHYVLCLIRCRFSVTSGALTELAGIGTPRVGARCGVGAACAVHLVQCDPGCASMFRDRVRHCDCLSQILSSLIPNLILVWCDWPGFCICGAGLLSCSRRLVHTPALNFFGSLWTPIPKSLRV